MTPTGGGAGHLDAAAHPRYNDRMDKDEMKWERIRDVLIAEGTGKASPRVSSTRTLFGIPSAVDQALDAIVAEQEAKYRARGSADGPQGQSDSVAAPDK